jgi:hypothetical protein
VDNTRIQVLLSPSTIDPRRFHRNDFFFNFSKMTVELLFSGENGVEKLIFV